LENPEVHGRGESNPIISFTGRSVTSK
jgi:hypothetical protein